MKRVFSLLALASPLIVGVFRAASTGWSDLRYLWMAIVAVAATLALRAALPKQRPAVGGAIMFAAITVLVAGTAWILGARHPVGVGLVSISYGLACAGSLVFATLD